MLDSEVADSSRSMEKRSCVLVHCSEAKSAKHCMLMVEQMGFSRGSVVLGSLKRRHSAPYLSTLEQFVGAEKPWRGSRFWALEDDDNGESDDDVIKKEGEDPDEEAYNSESEFIRDATRVGFSVDDLIRAESLLTENFQSPKFASVDRGAGHVSHPRPLASRITEAVADLRFQRTGKTWKGPLPKPRSPQNR